MFSTFQAAEFSCLNHLPSATHHEFNLKLTFAKGLPHSPQLYGSNTLMSKLTLRSLWLSTTGTRAPASFDQCDQQSFSPTVVKMT